MLDLKNIWENIDILINNFKRYDLEKRIQYVAKNAVNSELMASQLQAIKGKVKQTQEEDYLKKFDDNNNNNNIANSILKENNEEVQKLNAANDVKHAEADESIQAKLVNRKKNNEKNTRQDIQKTATSAVAAGLMSSQIKKTAIQAIEDNVEKIKYPDDFHSDDDDYEDDFEEDDNEDHFKSTVNQIKETAIQAIKDKEFDELQVVEEIEYEEEKDIRNTATNAVSTESTASQIKEASKNAVIKGVETKNVAHDIATNLVSNVLTNVITTPKKIIMTFIKKYNSLRLAILAIKKAAITALTDAVAPKDITELIKQTAINKVLESLPKVAEPKIDVKHLIENAAINKVNDAVKDAFINDLKIKLVEKETIIAENVKRNLEEIAIKTVERATIGSAKTAPGTSTGPNIENDLKNAAITALYRALLGVPRETIKPIDITKPQTDFDIRITDKTYTYDEKGERKEIPELTKYDRILAKEQK